MDITLTKSAAALLNGNRVKLTDCRAQNDGKPCNAMVFLRLELQNTRKTADNEKKA